MSIKGKIAALATLVCTWGAVVAPIPSVYAQTETAALQTIAIIPQPLKLTLKSGSFSLNAGTTIYVDPENDELKNIGQALAQYIQQISGNQLKVTQAVPNKDSEHAIYLTLAQPIDSLGAEGYKLQVTSSQVTLAANKPQGLFLGTQTIRQLLPSTTTTAPVSIPALEVVDKPRYAWRGMHLDVARHFFSVEFVKKYIDYLAMHKMNTFHWHLTEDQGWRIEIKKYPKLTEVGAWRDGTLIGHYSDQPHQFDDKRYGGYYTQEQIKEVVKYAQDRYITVIPEIEMPGHSIAALTAYPELSCTGGPFKVEQLWGVFDDVYCAGNEQTFEFLEDVLTEVMDLFPSKIIHIGGDESPKSRWEKCPKCQARIAAENLKNEHELQSYFIQRMEKFVNSKGRTIIGWDEILEGGLAPNAYVMSWRGTEGGIAAAKQHHYVVMTPGSHVYFDHYQGEPNLEPVAIGGYTTLEKVYSFEPTPAELSEDEKKYILGAQANVWTEYIPTSEQVEYMVLPRMSALSEVLWTPAKQKDWENFKARMQQQYQRFDALGANYARSTFNVRQQIAIDTTQRVATVNFLMDAAGPQVFYTLNGSEPTPSALAYTSPFPVSNSATIKAASFSGGKMMGKVTSKDIKVHKAFAHPIQLTTPAHPSYTASGAVTLVNGLGGTTNHTDGQWLGFFGSDMEALIDLDEITKVSTISSSFLQNTGAEILLPTQIEIAVSKNGKKFKTVKVISDIPEGRQQGTFKKELLTYLPKTKARFIKVTARNAQANLNTNGTAGKKTWVFVDEIVVK
ncbi:beta-N-acetylhexosaminidase [Pontibacter silvestris]|uniref:beta-N-acetylhexosaminidase n=1 Tax=Pontibacter silvestris TaxID=2305183 RepID=A0ABW4WT16_9BACT|nr:family 20 glycosylhydrolase [Pontibacter silvestris]MCC9138407.1 family 20 glycosylhydrolase [Pontibacter silvestris]